MTRRIPLRWLLPALLATLPPAAAAQPDDPIAALLDRACLVQVPHQPDASVGYQGGADLYGRPVAPADLSAPPPVLDGPIRLDLTVDVAEWLGLDLAPAAEVRVGTLIVGPEGLTLDGQRLPDDAPARLAAACRARALQP